MSNVKAERFAIENELEIDEVLDFFRGLDFKEEEV